MLGGFAATSAAVTGWLWGSGALGPYWEEVWRWGRLYAGSSPVDDPLRNGLIRTLNWTGFHVAAVIAAGRFLAGHGKSLRWLGWLALSLVGVAARSTAWYCSGLLWHGQVLQGADLIDDRRCLGW